MVQSKKSSRASGVWLALIIVAGVVAFSSALIAPFVFDDIPAIDRNPTIRHFSASTFDPPRDTPVAGRPIVNATFAANYAVNELIGLEQDSPASDPLRTVGYHFFNILVHCFNAVLLFALIRRVVRLEHREWLRPDFVAGVAALLWLLHPIQSEAVDYTIQRTELLVSSFYLLTIYCAIRAWQASPERRAALRWDVGAVMACMAGMASKEVMITAPLTLMLFDRTFLFDSWAAIRADVRRVRLYVALFATSFIVVAYTLAGVRAHSVGYGLGVTWLQYFYTQAWAIPRYLRLIVWPSGLTFDYGDSPVTGIRPLLGVGVIAVCAAGIIVAWRRSWRWLAFLGAWFFVLLAPSSSIIPIKTEIAAERRVYLASASLFVLIAVGLEYLRRRLDISARTMAVTTTLACATLAICTFGRGLTFRTQETLYADVVAKAPTNPRGYVGLGLAKAQHGPSGYPEAASLFRKAVSVDSNSFDGWQSLGIISIVGERWSDATDAFRHALRINPSNLDSDAGMARADVRLGELDSAAIYVDRIGSADPEVLWMLGQELIARRRDRDAVPFLERSANAMPGGRGPALLGVALAHIGNATDAIKAEQVATTNNEQSAEVYAIAAEAMRILHRKADAESYLSHALRIDSNSVVARAELDSLHLR
jgi:tetratricopeptide (TPR) repeat protein